MIFADPRNPTAERLKSHIADAAPNLVADDALIVVVGGDGFMLQSIHEHGLDRTYLGINAGRVGFLMNGSHDLDELLGQLEAQQWTAIRFPTLEANITLESGETVVETAINDIYLERSTGQTAHLSLRIDDKDLVDLLVSDGIILSTALGSTAYSLSAGGPACHPTLETMTVTPICPHRPRLAPLILPRSSRARVDVNASHRRPVRAVADGRTLDHVLTADVGVGPQSVHIAYVEGHDFTTALVTKILRS